MLINEFKKTKYQDHEINDLTLKLIIISWIIIDWGRLNCPVTWKLSLTIKILFVKITERQLIC